MKKNNIESQSALTQPLKAVVVNGKKKVAVNGVVYLDAASGGSGGSGGAYTKVEVESGSAVTLTPSEYPIITVTDDVSISLSSEDISAGATIYEYSGELVFGDTMYTVAWPSVITHFLGETTYTVNTTYLFNVLNDSVQIIKKA